MFQQRELLIRYIQEQKINKRNTKLFKIKRIAILLNVNIFIFTSLQLITLSDPIQRYSNFSSEKNILIEVVLQLDNLNEQNPQFVQNEESSLNTEKTEAITDHKSENMVQGNSDNNAMIEEDKKMVYLTFDDGPRAVSCDILQLLKEYDVKATFFMLEPGMRKYAESVQQMVDDGHSVGLHGVTHNKNSFYASKSTVIDEMNIAQQTLEEITGVTSFLIRTPYGSKPFMTDEYMDEVSENSYLLWDWNIDSSDWRFRSELYVDHVIKQLKQKEDSKQPIVILLHEIPETLQHLPLLLNYLVENGYGFGVLNESMEPIQL
ncbi:polysaccharide deacetylase family protein [Chengkuizengella sediminis]|uniref:polysaccharide deacetylase family protein n=1 Tax=Chengkuizengella sediminis TaxID=1885917 RepID=UPI00138A33D5|nr:polysaccharide deacetylase family protein [Chengkuizengella sediminis]NDI35668.1 polysaccharide deacetylase [Chengkuizengella sediminis]